MHTRAEHNIHITPQTTHHLANKKMPLTATEASALKHTNINKTHASLSIPDAHTEEAAAMAHALSPVEL